MRILGGPRMYKYRPSGPGRSLNPPPAYGGGIETPPFPRHSPSGPCRASGVGGPEVRMDPGVRPVRCSSAVGDVTRRVRAYGTPPRLPSPEPGPGKGSHLSPLRRSRPETLDLKTNYRPIPDLEGMSGTRAPLPRYRGPSSPTLGPSGRPPTPPPRRRDSHPTREGPGRGRAGGE